MNALLLVLLLAQLPVQAGPPLWYSDFFSDRYSQVVSGPLSFPKNTPLEARVDRFSPQKTGQAIVLRTDGTQIPYEDEVAHISVISEIADPSFIVTKDFRTITVQWVSERLLLIRRDIGHVAGIEELYDVIDKKFLIQKSIQYRWP